MENRIELISEGGLKCDNPNCDFSDSTIEVSEKSIGMPCPKCGENLLTEEDYLNVVMLFEAVNIYNSLTPEQIKELEALNLDIPKEFIGENVDVSQFNKDQIVKIKIETHKKVHITEMEAV